MLHLGLKSGNWMSGDGALLLDMTPATGVEVDRKQPSDHSLKVGETFYDGSRRVSVAPVAKVGKGKSLWADLRVVFGSSNGNRAPSVEVANPPDSVAVGEAFTLTAGESYSDGEELFYIWEFGYGKPSRTRISSGQARRLR